MINLSTFRTALVTSLKAAPSLKSNIQISSTAKLLARIVPVHISALKFINIMDESAVHLNLSQRIETIKKREITQTDIERILFGSNKERVKALRQVLKVEIMSFDLDGQTIESPVIFAKEFRVVGSRPLNFLIDGKIHKVKLAASQPMKGVQVVPPEVSSDTSLSNEILKGIPGSPGYGMGAALHLLDWEKGIEIRKYQIPEDQVEKEVARFFVARDKAIAELEDQKSSALKKGQKELAEILEAHIIMVNDKSVERNVLASIRNDGWNAEHVLEDVINGIVKKFENIAEPYIKEKTNDVKDAGRRILKFLCEIDGANTLSGLKEEVVMVAKNILPSDAANLYLVADKVKGIIDEEGGPTSHTAIIARSMGIPAVMGIKDATSVIKDGDKIAVYGAEGTIVVNPDEITSAEFADRKRVFSILVEEIGGEVKGKPSQTLDGSQLSLEGNIGTNNEIPMLQHFEAEKIGLYRTEFLYTNRENPPTEDELCETFLNIKLPAKIRTFDFGGDKELADYMPYLPSRETSFLGLRGVRLYFHDEWWKNLFTTELKAILRVSAKNESLQIMYPMISKVAEFKKTKKLLQEIMKEFKESGVNFNPQIKNGIMVEVPSAVNVADELAKEVDFFSIGSNDLVQYTLAIDRNNPYVGDIYDPFHRSLISSYQQIIEAGKQAKIEVGLCGEIASDPVGAMILAGMGINSLSMSPSDIPIIKYMIRSLNQTELKSLAEKALNIRSEEMFDIGGRERILILAAEALSLESYKTILFIEKNFRGGQRTLIT